MSSPVSKKVEVVSKNSKSTSRFSRSVTWKYAAFAISGFIAGLGGAMLAIHQESVNYGNNFSPFAGLFGGVTLAWTDPASTTSAAKNLVNDLDLAVTAPGGTQPGVPGGVGLTFVLDDTQGLLVTGTAAFHGP